MSDVNMNNWGAELLKRRPDVTPDVVQKFVTKMFRTNADFVFTVTRDFVPDDVATPKPAAMRLRGWPRP